MEGAVKISTNGLCKDCANLVRDLMSLVEAAPPGRVQDRLYGMVDLALSLERKRVRANAELAECKREVKRLKTLLDASHLRTAQRC